MNSPFNTDQPAPENTVVSPYGEPVSSLPSLVELGERLVARGLTALAPDAVDAFIASGESFLLFADDPLRYAECWDAAVILPEVLKALPRPVNAGFLLGAEARQVQKRYGFSVWPALVVLRDGGYVGTLEGMRDWAEYQQTVNELLDRPVSRPPTLGIPVRNGDAGTACH